MKTLVLALSAVLLLSFGFQRQNKDLSGNNQSGNIFPKLNCPNPPSFSETVKNEAKKKGSKKDEKEIDQNWYQKALENIKNEEYNITYDEKLGAFQSPNRENNIRFIYHKDGFTAVTREVRRETLASRSGKDEWKIQLRITNDELRNENSEIIAAGNKAYIENENIRIDYTNTKEGMRQDFIVKNKLEGDGKLRLNLSADTKLKMIVGADALMFKDKDGIDKMKYSALKCWDANGKELRAYFEKNELQITNDLPRSKAGKLQIENQKKQIPNQKNQKSKIKDQKSFAIVVNDEEAVYPITIDPLSTSPDWTIESEQAGANFGFSAATAGDVNGDGYSDIITGALVYDNGQTDEGRVFVFHGSATGFSSTFDWRAESNQATAYFGGSVATAGDVNGDGYSDIIIGSITYDSGQTDEGKVFVWYGSASGLGANGTPVNADWTAESDQADADFGFSVSTAGDVNGDGYSDVIIGAQKYSNGLSEEGRAFLFLGSATGLSSTEDWRGESNQANANFGCSVSTAGDVNGDGRSDVVIGAKNYDNGESNEGRTFIWYGTSSGLGANGIPGNADWSEESDQADAQFGGSVATAGDINGDGYSDIIISASLYDSVQTNEGRVYIYYGSPTGPSLSANRTIEINQDNAQFGSSVAPAGDVNGDGYGDVIIGANLFDNGESNEGSAYVYFGSASGLSASANWTAESNQIDANFGFSVSTAGDINGDGYADVIVGAFAFDNGQTDEGRVFVYNGTPDGLSTTSNWTAESDQATAFFGVSVSTAGDVNGDGYADVIVGAFAFDNGQTDEGRAFVYNGSASGLSVTANWTAESDQAGAYFGYSVSTAGDVNGDGYSDVIVGAYRFDNGQSEEGRAFVYNGSASGLSVTANWSAESNQASAFFGYSVSTAGDVNGDGFSDVIVGAYLYDNGQTDEGRAFVYNGSASGLSATANWTAESNQAGALFGLSISTAGDVNGDGYSDVIVGAGSYDNGQTNEGRAYVYHGSATGLSATANWTAESDQAGAYFGYSVSTAGDVNGDGYSNVIVGAYQFDNGQTDEGRAFVYNGSASGLSATANWTAESNQADAHFGYRVSTSGDVNGDGYSDVIVGAINYTNGQTDEGRAFVYYGSATGLSATANWTAESNQAGAIFGISVSTAGDVNGDGYSDVIVGAYLYSNGESDEGRAFVYYGNAGTGLRTTVQQYKPGTSSIIYSGGLSGTNGQARLNIFGKSPYGRADGKIIYEYKDNGIPFSGAIITNSTSSSGSGASTDLGTSITGVQLNNDISGLLTNKEYKWRTRVQYNLVNNPYQKLGPWKYYTNFVPMPFGCLKAITIDNTGPAISYTNLTDTSSLTNRTLNNVAITDASGVEGASGTRPRIYFKKQSQSNTFINNTNSTNGWKYAEATGSNSPFTFTIDYSLLNGGKNYGDIIQYFVTAQDVRSFGPVHTGINSGTFAASPVSVNLTAAAFPIGGTINSYKIIDNAPPSISYSNLSDTASLSNRILGSVVVTDSAGVQGASGTRPRVYYKRINNLNEFNDNTNATQGWKYSEATEATSPFSFVINYSLINGGLNTSDTVVYFVVAQDLAPTPNIKIVQGTFAAPPASVNLTSAAFPIGGPLKDYKITDLGAPSISLTNLTDTTSLSNRPLNNVVITDSSGIEGSTGFRPRVYFKKTTNANTFVDNTNSTNGWKYASATGSVSPFSFIIDYSLLNGSIAANDSVQYFVVAQDKYIPPFTAINSGTFAASPSSVDLTSAAFPVNGTIKSYKITVPSVQQLYLTVLIQGFYDAGLDNFIQDTVSVYLRSSVSPYDIIDSAKAYQDGSGKTGPLPTLFNFSNAASNVPYYLQASHRNSIQIWSGDTISFLNNELYYSFIDAASQAFGNNMKQVNTSPVRFAMFSGDANQDGSADLSDITSVFNSASNFVTGYVVTDMTGDNNVDLSDLTITFNNSNAFVSKITP